MADQQAPPASGAASGAATGAGEEAPKPAPRVQTISLAALIDYAFGSLRLRRLEADVDPGNAASLRILERMGFVREGLLRERWDVGGQIGDTAFLGLLAREWQGRRA